MHPHTTRNAFGTTCSTMRTTGSTGLASAFCCLSFDHAGWPSTHLWCRCDSVTELVGRLGAPVAAGRRPSACALCGVSPRKFFRARVSMHFLHALTTQTPLLRAQCPSAMSESSVQEVIVWLIFVTPPRYYSHLQVLCH